MHLLLLLASLLDNSSLTQWDVAAVVAIGGSLKEVWPSHAVDVEAAVVVAVGPAVKAGTVAHKMTHQGEDQHCWPA